MESERGDAEEDVECTICMESVSESMALPCQCKLDYCLPCWDKALANSFSQCGQARCPSCRSLVRVDFDSAKQCLVFSSEALDMTFTAQNELRHTMLQAYAHYVQSFSSEDPQSGAAPERLEDFVQHHPAMPEFEHISKMRNETITRLRHQAMPALKAVLQRYGENNIILRTLRDKPRETLETATVDELKGFLEACRLCLDDCLEKSEMVERLIEKASMPDLISLWAQVKCQPLKCVCGSLFQQVSAVERFRRSPNGERITNSSDEDVQSHLEHLQARNDTIIICDICEEAVPIVNAVWTCNNRTSTILHATSYDVCNGCFVHQVCGEEPVASEPTEM